MAEPLNAWTGYYEELDPEKRRELYQELAESGGALELFLDRLYRERYCDPRNPGRRVDTWLWKFVYLPGLYRKRTLSKRAFLRETEQTIAELHLDEADALPADQQQALFLEYRNAARRFFSTCRGRRYGSRLFGFKEASDREKKEKACEEVWMTSRGVALASGKEREMELFCEALRKEAGAFYPDCGVVFERLEIEFSRQAGKRQ